MQIPKCLKHGTLSEEEQRALIQRYQSKELPDASSPATTYGLVYSKLPEQEKAKCVTWQQMKKMPYVQKADEEMNISINTSITTLLHIKMPFKYYFKNASCEAFLCSFIFSSLSGVTANDNNPSTPTLPIEPPPPPPLASVFGGILAVFWVKYIIADLDSSA